MNTGYCPKTTASSRNYHYNPDGSRGVPRLIEVRNKTTDNATKGANSLSSNKKLQDSLSEETLATFNESFSTFGNNGWDNFNATEEQQQDLVSISSSTTTLSDRDDCLYNPSNLNHSNNIHKIKYNPPLSRIPKEEKQLELQKFLCQQDTILCNQMDSSDKYLDKCLSKMMETISTSQEEDWSTFTAFCNDYHPSNNNNNNLQNNHSPPPRRRTRQAYIYDPYNRTKIYLQRNHLSFWTIAKQSLGDAKKSKLFLLLNDEPPPPSSITSDQDIVEVRGCFDHFHKGHHQLLEGALLVAKKFLLVTVVSKPINKQYMTAYQPLEEREEQVRSYLRQHHDRQQKAKAKNHSWSSAPKIYVVNDQIRKHHLAHLEIDVGVYGSEYYGCPEVTYTSKKVMFVAGNCKSLSTKIRKQQKQQQQQLQQLQQQKEATKDYNEKRKQKTSTS